MSAIPTEEQIRSLPLWAAVSFGARCARRVQPLFQKGYPKARKDVLAAVEAAVAIAEEFAGRGARRPDYAAEADGDHAIDAASVARQWAPSPVAVEAANSAGGAAYAAGAAGDLAAGEAWGNREIVYSNVWRAVRRAAAIPDAVAGIAEDYSRWCRPLPSTGGEMRIPYLRSSTAPSTKFDTQCDGSPAIGVAIARQLP